MHSRGVLVGGWVVGLAVLCVLFIPGPRRVADRFIIAAAFAIGWLPLVGWIPAVGTALDVPGLILAAAAGIACAYQLSAGSGNRRSVAAPTPSEGAALVVAAAVTLWWARSVGPRSASHILAVLRKGGDNDTHFAVFSSNVQLGSFIQVRPSLASGGKRLGYDYPQGLHQAWAQYARLVDPRHSASLVWLLHSYVDVLVLTAGGIVLLGCLAAARLCGHDRIAALPAMAVVVALFGVGRFGPFNGFPNYELAIAAAAVAVTLIVRPTMSATGTFIAVSGLTLAVAYNWLPIIVLMVPVVAVAAIRAVASSRGRRRQGVVGLVVVLAVAAALPFATISHRGVSFLNVSGSVPTPSWGLLIASIATLAVVAALRQSAHPDLATNLAIGSTAVLGGAAVAVLSAYEIHSVGSVSYYGVKLAAGVLGVCLTVLACLLAGYVSTADWRASVPTPWAVGAIALISVAALQVDGYVGPLYGALQVTDVAQGIPLHNAIAAIPRNPVDAATLLRAAQVAQSSRASDRTGRWWYVDPVRLAGQTAFTYNGLTIQWFTILRGNPTDQEYYKSAALGWKLTGALTEREVAMVVIHSFPNPVSSDDHLYVPGWLRAAMVRADPTWRHPGLLHLIPGT